jgi:hypothetical protein
MSNRGSANRLDHRDKAPRASNEVSIWNRSISVAEAYQQRIPANQNLLVPARMGQGIDGPKWTTVDSSGHSCFALYAALLEWLA